MALCHFVRQHLPLCLIELIISEQIFLLLHFCSNDVRNAALQSDFMYHWAAKYIL